MPLPNFRTGNNVPAKPFATHEQIAVIASSTCRHLFLRFAAIFFFDLPPFFSIGTYPRWMVRYFSTAYIILLSYPTSPSASPADGAPANALSSVAFALRFAAKRIS